RQVARALYRNDLRRLSAGANLDGGNPEILLRSQIVQHQMDGIGLGISDRNLQQVVSKFGRRTVRRHVGEILPRLAAPRRTRRPCRNTDTRHRVAPLVQAAWPAESKLPGAKPPVSHPDKPRAPARSAASYTPAKCPPCAGYTPHPVPPRTTFFSRCGFRSWVSNRTRMV